ncbi:hypothetical protein HCR_23050 (plasmid) [Hydrogenimonas cancrithermarum]|uniref:Uncharacterized protein n=1 Tax=Hydrogenimonas cancrithermarum TaxID=2993563 RepID=A0ABN6WXS2_9BACT|nr:hypothetical protein HCR_23050 [Hydrogenimonas cancrithermarum]
MNICYNFPIGEIKKRQKMTDNIYDVILILGIIGGIAYAVWSEKNGIDHKYF